MEKLFSAALLDLTIVTSNLKWLLSEEDPIQDKTLEQDISITYFPNLA